MGTKLPYLPFWGDKESKQFAKYALNNNAGPTVDETAAASDWHRSFDGRTIYAKPPSQFFIHVTKIDRNWRVRNM